MRQIGISLCLAALVPTLAPALAEEFVTVLEVADPSAAQLAGIGPGDRLISWSRGAAPPANPTPASGTFRSPFDVALIELEQGPRGPVELVVRRDGETIHVTLPHDDWGIEVAPQLGPDERAILDEAIELLSGDDPGGAVPSIAALAALLNDSSGPEAAAWAHAELARRADADRLFDIAVAQVDEAIATLGPEVSPALEGELLERRCRTLAAADRFEEAQLACERSLEVRQREPGASLSIAMSMHRLGIVFWYRGEMASAAERFAALVEIRRQHAPGSLILATSIMNQGLISPLPEREGYYLQSLEIREHLDPQSMATALLWHNLGALRRGSGDYSGALEAYSRASAIHEAIAPVGPEAALTEKSKADVQLQRGRLDEAEAIYLRVLEIQEKLAPGGLDIRGTYISLGAVYGRRGSYRIAQQYLEQALAIAEAIAPDSPHVVTTLSNLGVNARRLGDLVAAENYYRRVLEIEDHAETWNSLGVMAMQADDLASAEHDFDRAIEIAGEQAPRGLTMARVQSNLSLLRSRQGRPAEAVAAGLQAVELYENLAPGSLDHARAERAVGWAYAAGEEDRTEPSIAAYRRAVEILDAQRATLGGSFESRSRWSTQATDIYHEAIALLMRAGKHRLAFEVLERSRARTLLEVLSGRDLALADAVPADLEAERRRLGVRHDAILGWLGRQPDASDEGLAVARADLDEVRRELDANLRRIRAATPLVAELRAPQPLNLAESQASRDPGTAILTYATGPLGSYLFVLGPGPDAFAALSIEANERAIEERVTAFREILFAGRSTRRRTQVNRQAVALGRLLIGPASDQIRKAERVLIVPDGPLHGLPFAALGHPGEGDTLFLIESKPVHLAASISVHAASKQGRREMATPRLVAFGDPTFGGPKRNAADATRGRTGVMRDLGSLTPLPDTRAEVEALEAIYGDAATVWLGAAATEARARMIGRDANLIHFATHGLIDDHLPLESALALSPPQEDQDGNGLLHAWEIIESMRLDADLVTLSACESALGERISGEGVLGLTRAFQHAGARSVLASLWTVADRSTAALMQRFYSNLNQGMDKASALRSAQLALLSEPVVPPGGSEPIDARAPYAWAAFQLYGDYR